MKEALEKAKEELKRVDHLIYVSLKYTRTCDVLKSIVERLINAIDFMIESMLKKAREEKKVTTIPTQPRVKCLLLAEKIEHEELKEMCNFYILLRNINQSKFTREREYRRHVAMVVEVEGKKLDVDIDAVMEYFKKTKRYYEIIEKAIHGNE